MESFQISLEEVKNPFLEEGDILLKVSNGIIEEGEAVESVKQAGQMDITSYEIFIQERLVTCQELIHKVVSKNTLRLFKEKKSLATRKGRLKTISLINNIWETQ